MSTTTDTSTPSATSRIRRLADDLRAAAALVDRLADGADSLELTVGGGITFWPSDAATAAAILAVVGADKPEPTVDTWHAVWARTLGTVTARTYLQTEKATTLEERTVATQVVLPELVAAATGADQ